MRAIISAVFAICLISAALAQPTSRGLFGCGANQPSCEMPPPKWVDVQGDNGQIYYIDTASIKNPLENDKDEIPPALEEFYRKFGRVRMYPFQAARALVFIDDGRPISHLNAGWYDFNCESPYMIGPQGTSPRSEYLPPRSIGAKLRVIACGGPY